MRIRQSIGYSLSRPCKEPEGSIPNSQIPATRPHPEPDAPSPYPHPHLNDDPSNKTVLMLRLPGGKLHFLQVSRANVLNALTVSTYQKLNSINTLPHRNTRYHRHPARGYEWKDTYILNNSPLCIYFMHPVGRNYTNTEIHVYSTQYTEWRNSHSTLGI